MFKAYINDRAELTFADIQEAARFQAAKEANKGASLTITVGEVPEGGPAKRTEQQNRALHLWFEHVAKALNNAGLSTQQVLSHYKMELDWTKERVKEDIWKPVQKAVTGKTSTTELKKQEDITLVWEHINRFFADKLKMETIPFPSHEPGYADTAPLNNN